MSALAFTACDNSPKFVVEGTINNAADSTLYLEADGLSGIETIDSVKLGSNGNFSFKGAPSDNPEFYHNYGFASEKKDDSLTIRGSGDTITIYAQTSLEAGSFDIYIDDVKMGSANLLQSKTYTLNQYIDHISQVLVKRFYGLENKEHVIKIVNNSNEMVEIDSISFAVAK